MIEKATFDFLRQLAENNHRAWFGENKERYERARANTLEFLNNVCSHFPTVDPELAGLTADKAMMRIYRDIRFSKDKTPYKTNFSAGFSPNGKMSNEPGYYISVSPDGTREEYGNSSFFAAGHWMPQPAELSSIRQEIDYNSATLTKILDTDNFKTRFKALSEEGKLKKPPKGYAPDDRNIELLKHKSFVVTASLTEAVLTSSKGVHAVVELISTAFPLVAYLREASRKAI